MDQLQILNNTFDKIFVLTLEGQTERQEHMRQVLKGVEFEFFYGVNKNNFTIDLAEKNGEYNSQLAQTRVRSGKPMQHGMIACSWSHKKIYEKVIDENLNSVLIFEDDLQPLNSNTPLLSTVLNELPDNWELLYLGYWKNEKYGFKERLRQYQYHILKSLNLVQWSHTRIKNIYAKPYSKHLKIAGNHETTHAYAVTKSAAEKLIKLQSPISYNPDHLLTHAITSEQVRAFLTHPMMFWQLSLEEGNSFENLTI